MQKTTTNEKLGQHWSRTRDHLREITLQRTYLQDETILNNHSQNVDMFI